MKRSPQAGSLRARIVERHVAEPHGPIELELEGIELRTKNGELELAGGEVKAHRISGTRPSYAAALV